MIDILSWGRSIINPSRKDKSIGGKEKSKSLTNRQFVERWRGAFVNRGLLVMVSLTFLLGGVLAHSPASAQGPEAENPRLDLGFALGARGFETELSLTLRLVREVEVGKVEAEILFPDDQLAFIGARPAAAEGVPVEVELQPMEQHADDAGQAVLKVVAESVEGPIPAGVLATLVFRVAEEAQEADLIDVELRASLWAYPDISQEITPLETYDGRVTVQEEEVFFACFFYLH